MINAKTELQYCRVSSDSADQLHSYAAQIRYYTDLIQNYDGWDLVDVYADEGITGTRMDKREDFNRLLADCRKGKIDKVLVKSISRFARNTRDCLASLRELFRLGVSVLFEKENIDTGTLTTELMVSVSSSLAQQESVSISQNQQMSYQRRMERGEFITCTAPYGYRMPDGKNLVIEESEAREVQWMFQAYLDGNSVKRIAEEMNRKEVHNSWKRGVWYEQLVRKMLSNEKYVGDSLCQKTYTANTFPFVKKTNHGEVDQYYIENTHPAIISRETFDKVQNLLKKRAERRPSSRQRTPLSLKVICGNCGSVYMRRVNKSGHTTWVCRKHDRNAIDCPNGRVPEAELYGAFVRMYNKLKRNAGVVLWPAIKQMEELRDVIQRGNPAMLAVNKAIAKASEQSYNISKLQTAGLLDTDACTAKFNEISAQLAKLRAERRRLLENEDIDDAIDALQQTVDLNGKRIFTMGGASSHDIQGGILEPDDPLFLLKFHTLEAKGTPFRVNHRSWWKEELPSTEEYLEARRNLDKAGWEVDYIITHCAPTSIQNELLRERSKPDELTDFLEEVRQRCRFRYHFFGHYHGDGIIQKKFVLLHRKILRLK